MIGFLTYMAIGALLLFFTFNIEKFKEALPTLYINYKIDAAVNNPHDPFSEKTFTKIVAVFIFSAFAFGWPIILIKRLIKLSRGEK